MTPEEKAIQQLNGITDDDPESAHADADEILLEFLEEAYPRIAESYREVRRRQHGWWFA
jgi:hypothetical protein